MGRCVGQVKASERPMGRNALTKVVAMLTCEHCASHKVHWFTPRTQAHRGAVLLCMACRRLTIVSTHTRHGAVGLQQDKAA